MSTKTLRKRIALVAALALGTGVLSVAPANAASPADLLRDEMTTSTTITQGSNLGICYSPSATLDNADATNLVEMLSTGSLLITGTDASDMDNGHGSVFTITGPAVWSAWTNAATTGMAGVLTGDQKVLTFTSASTNVDNPTALVVKPTGVGTVQVAITTFTATATAAVEIITIAVKATCAAGVFSAADSYTKMVAVGDISTAAATSADATDAAYTANGGSLYVRFDGYDANGTAITSTTDILTAETTSGAVIGAAATGVTTMAVTTDLSTYFKVNQATTDAPWSGTITLKLNGVTVATKSAKIIGAPKTIEVSGVDLRAQGGSDAQGGDYVMKDAAGNIVETAISGWDTLTLAQSAVLTVGASSRTPNVGAVRTLAGTTKGQFNYACNTVGPNSVAKGVRLKYTNSSLVSIYSPTFDITCGGAAYTYTASLDKASYVPGDIATLTITAKDAYGNPVADATAIATAANKLEITGSQLTAVTTPAYTDTYLGGSIAYKFTVGSTEGSYNALVSLIDLNSASKPQSALAVKYSVSSGTTTVTNAQVLQSIVALIASINKQIQALQKLILARR